MTSAIDYTPKTVRLYQSQCRLYSLLYEDLAPYSNLEPIRDHFKKAYLKDYQVASRLAPLRTDLCLGAKSMVKHPNSK